MRRIPMTQWILRHAVSAAFVMLAAGCAGWQAHREGVELMAKGSEREALRKLEEASRLDPHNLEYRLEFRSASGRYVSSRLEAATRARVQGDFVAASASYREVLDFDANNTSAHGGLAEIEREMSYQQAAQEAEQLRTRGDLRGALGRLQRVLAERPEHPEASRIKREIDAQRQVGDGSTPQLSLGDHKPVTLQFRDAPIKLVFEALSRTSGLNVILDKEAKSDTRVTIFVQNVPVEDALDMILAQTQLLRKVLNASTLIVYPNTPVKIKEYQDQVVRAFLLSNADAKQAAVMLKTVLNAKVTFTDDKSNLIVVRDTPELVRMAERLIASLDTREAEVMLEIEALEVTRSRMIDLGIRYPDKMTLTTIGGSAPGTLLLNQFKDISGSNVQASPVQLTVNMLKEDGDAEILANPRIRVRNREKAKVLIGDKVPVITNSVTPISGGQSVVTGNVQYVDVGLKLDIEPTIHADNDVAIKVTLEVSNIAKEIVTTSGTVAYQIGTRTVTTVLRLRDGETQVLAGLVADEDRSSASKIPGLGDLPVLGRLFGSTRDSGRKSEIILSITPRLVRETERPEISDLQFWYGTETMVREAPLKGGQPPAAGAPATGGATASLLKARPAPGMPGGLVPSGATKSLPPTPDQGAPATAAPKATPPPATGPAEITWEGPETAAADDMTEVLLVWKGGKQAFQTLEFDLAFPADQIEVMTVTEGDLVMGENAVAAFSSDINAETGKVRLTFKPDHPVAGSGNVALLVVRPKRKDTSPVLAVERVEARDADGGRVDTGSPPAHAIKVQ